MKKSALQKCVGTLTLLVLFKYHAFLLRYLMGLINQLFRQNWPKVRRFCL